MGGALERGSAARATASSSTSAHAPVPSGFFVEVGATFLSCAVPDRIEAIKSSRSPPPAGARAGTDGLLAWGGGGGCTLWLIAGMGRSEDEEAAANSKGQPGPS